jgi:hypothetical protein
MAHIRSFQTGEHAAESQKILNEIAAARVCLLNAEKKTAYDEALRAAIAPHPAVEQAIEQAMEPGSRNRDAASIGKLRW